MDSAERQGDEVRPSRLLRVAVLLSGNGSSLENLFEHIDAGAVQAEVVVVISSKENAFGLERARRRGISALAVPRKKHPDGNLARIDLRELAGGWVEYVVIRLVH